MTNTAYRIQGATGEWEVVIGLEVHAQVTSQSKLFSGAATEFGAEPNAQVSLVDAAMPGMLPVLNGECIRQAVRTGMAVGAQINRWSRFDRKNYFYADLPQGYQISQLYHPLVGEGQIEISPDDKNPDQTKTIGIERIHVEQDAGKLMHDQHPTMSYVDLNRSGVALMEIVSAPGHAFARRSRGLPAQAARDPALCRLVRRQHGRRLDARRRQCFGAQARRRVRHPDRDQERQFGALRDVRDRERGAPSGRSDRGWRQGGAGNALV